MIVSEDGLPVHPQRGKHQRGGNAGAVLPGRAMIHHRPFIGEQAAEDGAVLRREHLAHAAIAVFAITAGHSGEQGPQRIVVRQEQRAGAVIELVGGDQAFVGRAQVDDRAKAQPA